MRLLRLIREILLYTIWMLVAIGFMLYFIWVTGMIANCR